MATRKLRHFENRGPFRSPAELVESGEFGSIADVYRTRTELLLALEPALQLYSTADIPLSNIRYQGELVDYDMLTWLRYLLTVYLRNVLKGAALVSQHTHQRYYF